MGSVQSVLFAVIQKELLVPFGQIDEPKNCLTAESWTLHDAIRLEFVRGHDGATVRTLMGDNTHCYSFRLEFSPTTSR